MNICRYKAIEWNCVGALLRNELGTNREGGSSCSARGRSFSSRAMPHSHTPPVSSLLSKAPVIPLKSLPRRQTCDRLRCGVAAVTNDMKIALLLVPRNHEQDPMQMGGVALLSPLSRCFPHRSSTALYFSGHISLQPALSRTVLFGGESCG